MPSTERSVQLAARSHHLAEAPTFSGSCPSLQRLDTSSGPGGWVFSDSAGERKNHLIAESYYWAVGHGSLLELPDAKIRWAGLKPMDRSRAQRLDREPYKPTGRLERKLETLCCAQPEMYLEFCRRC